MPPIYVIQQNAKIRVSNRRLNVEQEGQILTSIPLGQVTQVVLFGNVGLTTPAIKALLTNNCDVVFLTLRGDYRGRLVGEVTPHVPLRRLQYQRLGQPEFVLDMAKGFIQAKLSHQGALLKRHNRKRNLVEIGASIDLIEKALEVLPRKTALSSIRGLEGSATAAYFRGLRMLFDPRLQFSNRNRRPPRDPVNVLLSFGYTLLTRLTTSTIEVTGLDPYAGFLHEVVYNRPGLGLDLVEEFRPVIDGLVLWCFNSEVIGLKDFSPGPAKRPVVLGETGQKQFLRAYEDRLARKFTHPIRDERLSLRRCILEQARQVVNRIKDDLPGYQGMGFR